MKSAETNEEFDLEFFRRETEIRLHGLILNGSINPKGKSLKKLLKEMAEIGKKGYKSMIVVDHTESLILTAEQHAKENTDLATALYGLWAEHKVNYMLMLLCRRGRTEEKYIETLVKDTNIRAKFILLHLLSGTPVPKVEFDHFQQIISARNEFVHYKWKSFDEKFEAKTAGALQGARLCVRYLDKFTIKHLQYGVSRLPKVDADWWRRL